MDISKPKQEHRILIQLLLLITLMTLIYSCACDPNIAENKVNLSTEVKDSTLNLTITETEGFTLAVAPTPVTDQAKVFCSSVESGIGIFRIYTEDERLLLYMSGDIEADEQLSFNWDAISKLDAGVYFVEMIVNGDRKAVVKFVKIEL